ncbi:hypothetical protein E2562_026719 [Oryza meyeriana var. granulata]|uniref:Uncharacterized protein n=1 Tax=Oryza meyeriana var. granulata TaxID=110450 RepID=A0A6G1EZ34_9ORYZ|nr:hypothetical protein E2562_026719 [Oryza meyeriana var. granulata]
MGGVPSLPLTSPSTPNPCHTEKEVLEWEIEATVGTLAVVARAGEGGCEIKSRKCGQAGCTVPAQPSREWAGGGVAAGERGRARVSTEAA